jgi:hypothetical protein
VLAWLDAVRTASDLGALRFLGENGCNASKSNTNSPLGAPQNGGAIFHLLTTDKAATTRAITKVGYKVTRETEVIVEHIEDRPGMLGKVTRRLADAGINLTTMYLATDTRLVLGCESIPALETAWKELGAVASR